MAVLIAFAFVAGVLTVLAPCTLPVIPFVLGASATGSDRRWLGVLVGFGGTFVATAVLLAAALAAADITSGSLRIAGALLLGLVGLSLAVDRFGTWAERVLAPVAQVGARIVGRRPRDGFAGGLVLGGAIGLVWAPCVGPIMAGVIAAAATRGPNLDTVAISLAYVVGALVPLSLLARAGASSRTRSRTAVGDLARWVRVRRAFGAATVLSAVLVVSGLDLVVENGVAAALPAGWSGALLAVEQGSDVQQEIAMLRSQPPQVPDGAPPAGDPSGAVDLPAPVATAIPGDVTLDDLGPAPAFSGIQDWINSPSLTIGSLRGKVVLVEFWTFGCINCQHVQPFVNAWYDRYAASGLVVVGVHTPELSFERDVANVRDAVVRAGIRYPVAVDPSFATWDAFGNAYWPAFYFIDRTGGIRHVHFGEGQYEESEQVIRELLAEGS